MEKFIRVYAFSIKIKFPDTSLDFIFLSMNPNTYLFSSNQLSTVVLVSMGSPKLDGLEEVTQNFGSSVQSTLLISFLFFLSLYSYTIPNPLIYWPNRQRELI